MCMRSIVDPTDSVSVTTDPLLEAILYFFTVPARVLNEIVSPAIVSTGRSRVISRPDELILITRPPLDLPA